MTPDRRRTLIRIVRFAILILVVWGIWHAFDKARLEFRQQQLSWEGLRWSWLLVSMISYAGGLLAMAWFWHRILHQLGQRPTFLKTVAAYYVGHLGKYVPGKALVVVLRTALVRGDGVDTMVAGISVFIETITMMAVGSFWATVVLVWSTTSSNTLRWIAFALALITLTPTMPPVFVFLVGKLLPRFENQHAILASRYNYRLVGEGWLACSVGWVLMAVSLWATLKSIPYIESVGSLSERLPLMVAAVALAMVLGFVSLLPGGVGVREWALDQLMVPHFGAVAALAAAIILRVVWLVTELAASAILYITVGRPTPSASPSATTTN